MPICPKGHNSATDDYCDECGAPIGVPGTAGASDASGAASPADEPAAAVQVCPICGSPRIGRFCEEDGYDFVLRPPVSPAPASIPAEPAAAESPSYSRPTTHPAAAERPAYGQPAAEPASAQPAAYGQPAAAQPATYGQPAAEPAARIPGHPPVTTAAQPWVAVVTADRDYFETIIALSGPDAASITFPAVCPERRIQLTGKEIVIGRHSASRGLNPQIDLSGPPEDPGVSHLHAVLQSTPDGGWTITDPGSTNGTTINDDTQPIKVGVPVPIHPGDRIHVGAWTTLTLTQPRPPGA